MNRFLLALFSVLVLGGVAHAQPPGTINQYNTICDWRSPKNCVAVNSSGAVSVTGSISASSSEHSTAAAPTYVEGFDNPLSGDLSGHLRTIANQGLPGSIDAGWPVSDSQALDASGTLTGSAQSVTASNTDGFAQVTVTINGTYGGISGIFEQSEDAAVTWYPAKCTQTDTPFSTGNSFTTLTNTSRLWHCPTNGSDAFRVRSTAYSSGTANIRISISAFPIADAMTDIISPGQSIGIDQTTPGTTNGVQTLTGSTTAVTGTVTIAGATTAADGTALTNNLKTFSTNGFYNGTTIDLGRSGDVNNQAAVTGVQDIMEVARYNATLPTITDTRYNALQVGQRGALQVQVMNADGTTGWAFAAPADAQALAASSAPVRGIMGVYNGATTDLTREIVNATNSVGTGILAAGILAQFDDVAPTSITENQFGNVRMSANRNQYATIRDAAGNERGVNVTAASTSAALTDPGMVVSLSPNPSNVCTGKTPINQTTSTDVKTFTNVGYICSIILVSATAQNISVIEGTGTVCATGTSAVIGGTTASMAVGVNGGFSAVSERPWVQLGVSADHLCILQSASGNVSGIITWQDHT